MENLNCAEKLDLALSKPYNITYDKMRDQYKRIDVISKMFDDLVEQGIISAPEYKLASLTTLPISRN